MAADLKGKSAEESEWGSHRRRDAQGLSLDDAAVPSCGPAKRMMKVTQDARSPAEIRESMYSGRRLNMIRQTDLRLARVSSGIKFSEALLRPQHDTTFPPHGALSP